MKRPHVVDGGIGSNLPVLWHGFRMAFADAQFRGLLGLTSTLIVVAAGFYHWAEGWDVLDAVYFSVMTVATVGYGDFVPTTDLGKIFTIVYTIAGIGLFVALVSALADNLIKARKDARERVTQRETQANGRSE